MKIRELLRYEIWSKRTSRKLLVGSAVLFVSLAVGFFAWYEIEIHWLTHAERNAVRGALIQIDSLESSDTMTWQGYEARSKQVEASVSAAKDAAITLRDNYVQMRLTLYMMGVESEKTDAIVKRTVEERHLQKLSRSPNEEKAISIMRQMMQNNRALLLKELE